MSQRRFGVEIEYISKLDYHETVKKLRQLNLTIDDYATGHARCPNECYSGWQVKSDGSITVQGEYEYGIELVSPPIALTNLGELKAALSAVNAYGAVNSSCGLHVHVHSPELYSPRSEARATKIASEWQKVEQTLFSYMPLSRRGNVHCKAGVKHDDRYQALNIEPLYSSRRTIEFRLHSATLNYDKISSWIMFCIRFVDRMAMNKPLELIDPKLILDVQPKLIKPKTGTTFYLHRPQPGWLIENKKLNKGFIDLREAWKETKDVLKLPGLNFLSDFHFPIYGNAMTQLCQELNIKGVYRSFIEDRYDRITKRFGFYDSSQNITTNFGEDEDDFYHEPDFESDDELNL